MNLLLDLDGTLTDPKVGIVTCMEYALQKLGRDPANYSKLERFIGPPLLASFIELLGDDDEALRAVELYRERFSVTGLFENEVYAGIKHSLAKFSMKPHRMMVATAKPHIFAKRILEHFELDSYFEHCFGSELDGRLSNKADLLALILETQELVPADTLMIGDRSHDIVAARANGIRSIGVLWGYGSAEELSLAGADALCESPPLLAALIDSLD